MENKLTTQMMQAADKCKDINDSDWQAQLLRDGSEEIERLRKALQPFADVGGWFFASPQVLDETPVVELLGLNGQAGALTRGHFKAANLALTPNEPAKGTASAGPA